jgi:hypothetical protein
MKLTKKQKEIQRILPILNGKVVQIWTTGQMSSIEPGKKLGHNKDPFITGKVDGSTGTYLLLKNAKVGVTEYPEYSVSIGIIAEIKPK